MEKLREIIQIIEQKNNFLISAHINPDGDSTGSQFAMYGILKKLNKNVQILNKDPIPRIYKFLPFSDINTVEYNGQTNFDVAIILDCGDIDRVGKLPIDIKKIKTIINIDHHISNVFFGNYNYVDPNASSAGELIYRLTKEWNFSLDKDIATCLYSAIMTDTGGFKFENTTSGAFLAVGELVLNGLNPNKISKNIYENNRINAMRLLGLALNNLTLNKSGKISYLYVTLDMIKETCSTAEDAEGFVSYARAIEGVEVGILFRETENSSIKVSIRSKEVIDTNKIANFFGGGGHVRASGCDIKGDLKTVMEKVIAKAEEEIGKI